MRGPALISCLMVTRDRARLAARAVACFAAQTWKNRELVIVDDGDEDYSEMLAPFLQRGLVIRYLRVPTDPSTKLGGLRNVAIDAAHGSWCMQWDDDEWYHPDRIAQQALAALRDNSDAVLLRWTLVCVDSPTLGHLGFRADAGIATPGTVLHRREAARYPNIARGEDSRFLRDLRRGGRLSILGRESSYLFVRCFHGDNTWDERHFLSRLHRRPVDWPSYGFARWWHRDLRKHRAFRLDDREEAAIVAASSPQPTSIPDVSAVP